MTAARVLFALLVNAIPAWGVFTQGWSVGTLLILFWWENLLGVLLIGLHLHLHQPRSADPAYRDPALMRVININGKDKRFAHHATGFLAMALPFAVVHGLFAILLPYLLGQRSGQGALWLPDSQALLTGAVMVLATLLLDFMLELPGLARRSFAVVKRRADSRMARVLILHLVLILGAFAAALFENPYGLLAVMILLKTAVDVAAACKAAPPAS
ncbi:MAG: DUF6498-containing protein [Chiayiivirga sp.]|jgi:hypothetical protein|uniref:DUF6498-containing protein n=1 Tax=Chiayiivirga sp. TaxID=2041042 RepID=UPI0025BCD4EE|nr:DUF6498-containing protein [Chiayiivirga sp.]MCI1711032.1 DUF6498-containing protein [Chiayiivirga sp.]MCI1728150.1 DUF6498-containing protein [Chiayiivirga sp.]